MISFRKFLQKILHNPSEVVITIKGKNKKLKAFSLFTTKNYPDDVYYKGIFQDGSFMLLIPKEQEIYYSDKLDHVIGNIKDEDIGTKKYFELNGKKYELGNPDDYQFTKQLFLGSPFDIEGEVRFSDYFPVDGPKEFLSLGWIVRTNERADINCKILDITEIEIN